MCTLFYFFYELVVVSFPEKKRVGVLSTCIQSSDSSSMIISTVALDCWQGLVNSPFKCSKLHSTNHKSVTHIWNYWQGLVNPPIKCPSFVWLTIWVWHMYGIGGEGRSIHPSFVPRFVQLTIIVRHTYQIVAKGRSIHPSSVTSSVRLTIGVGHMYGTCLLCSTSSPS